MISFYDIIARKKVRGNQSYRKESKIQLGPAASCERNLSVSNGMIG